MRNVRESNRFAEQKMTLGVSVQRLDDALNGVVWALSRNAEAYPVVPGTGYRVVKTDPFPDLCALRIFVIINDDTQITMDAVECIDDDEDDPAEPPASR